MNYYRKLIRAILKFITRISPWLNTQLLFHHKLGKWVDFHNPQTLNEKVQWLKLNTYYKNPLVEQCADKYAVREFVKKQGCEEILIELLGVWENPNDINFEQLPNKFVLKCSYFYNMYIICKNKSRFDFVAAKKEMEHWLQSDDHLIASEMQYGRVPKKIIAERYIETPNGGAPDDYKVYCCNGNPIFVMVCIDRSKEQKPKFYYYDTEGNLQRELSPDGLKAPMDFQYAIPKGWDKMIHYAKILSKPFPFVRVDFYIDYGKVIFGELTFTPAAGMNNTRGKLPYTDRLIGEHIILPQDK